MYKWEDHKNDNLQKKIMLKNLRGRDNTLKYPKKKKPLNNKLIKDIMII